jgi:hypothetical protein
MLTYGTSHANAIAPLPTPQELSLLALLVQRYTFTCFTGTKVHILTLSRQFARCRTTEWYKGTDTDAILLYWYTGTNTDPTTLQDYGVVRMHVEEVEAQAGQQRSGAYAVYEQCCYVRAVYQVQLTYADVCWRMLTYAGAC